MYRLHLTRNLRSLVFILVAATLLGTVATLLWANHTGLPESWRGNVERAISKHGAHLKIGALKYVPMRGVVASNVRVFSDPLHLHEVSRLQSVTLGFDKTKLARGLVKVRKIELHNARLSMPVDPENPDSETLDVTRANGTLYMTGDRRFEVRNARGTIAGINVFLNARIIGFQQGNGEGADNRQIGKRRQLIANVIRELNQWHFPPDAAPQLRISIEGDVNDYSALGAKLSLYAPQLEKNQHVLEQVRAEGSIRGDLLTLTTLQARDSRGELGGSLDYDVGDRNGRFDIQSSIDIPRLLKAWLDLPPIQHVLVGGHQEIEAVGEFQLGDKPVPEIRMTGRTRCESVILKGIQFDTAETAFSWRDGDLYLRDLRLARPEGQATGKAMIQWPLVRIALETNLPAHVGRPLFIGKPLHKVLGDFEAREGGETSVRLEGGFDATDRHSWAYTGSASVKNYNYRGVPVNMAGCDMSLSHYELDFTNGTVVFNYQDYPLRKARGGPSSGTAKIARIRYDAPNKTVEVEKVTGAIWAAPLVRLFSAKTADTIEAYRFHRPPVLRGSGIVDVTPEGRTTLDVSFSSKSPADYHFLGQDLTLGTPSGLVAIRGKRVTVDKLKVDAFGGPVAARFDARENRRLSGELSWTRLSMKDITSTYGFSMKGGGLVTGRLEFDIANADVKSMNGTGLLALEQSELFSVPIFGPLSPLIGGVLNNRDAGVERATSAFCNFGIKQGILSTSDFQTATTSLTFVGDGSVDLDQRSFDMTMRMNARGLFGLLTMPLRPLYGMFQFRGTGPLKSPTWEKVLFTNPTGEHKKLLMSAPKATVVPTNE